MACVRIYPRKAWYSGCCAAKGCLFFQQLVTAAKGYGQAQQVENGRLLLRMWKSFSVCQETDDGLMCTRLGNRIG